MHVVSLNHCIALTHGERERERDRGGERERKREREGERERDGRRASWHTTAGAAENVTLAMSHSSHEQGG